MWGFLLRKCRIESFEFEKERANFEGGSNGSRFALFEYLHSLSRDPVKTKGRRRRTTVGRRSYKFRGKVSNVRFYAKSTRFFVRFLLYVDVFA